MAGVKVGSPFHSSPGRLIVRTLLSEDCFATARTANARLAMTGVADSGTIIRLRRMPCTSPGLRHCEARAKAWRTGRRSNLRAMKSTE
jgi:hypothetical protein